MREGAFLYVWSNAGRLRKLSKPQVVKFYKFIRFYNKEYTRSLYDFIESNKDIYVSGGLLRSSRT